MNGAFKSVGCAVLLFFLMLPAAKAHPHVWISYSVKVTSSRAGIEKLGFSWVLDDAFSSLVEDDLKSKNIAESNGALVKSNAFLQLQNYNYYIALEADGQKFTFNDAQDFEVTKDNGVLRYKFTIAFPKPVSKFEMSVMDPSIYVDFKPTTDESVGRDPEPVPHDVLTIDNEGFSNPPDCTWQKSAARAPFPIYAITCDMNAGASRAATPSSIGDFIVPYLEKIADFQWRIHQTMTGQIGKLKEEQSWAAFGLLLVMSFAYGVFHVLAPGHGKVIVGTYFLGNKSDWRQSLLAGSIMAAGHTISAVGIVLVLDFVFGLAQIKILQDARYVELAGYGAVIAIGFWLFMRAFGKAPQCKACEHEHSHDHHHAHKQGHKHAASLFAAISLVPCTGSMIVLLFTLANHVLWIGILAVIAIALGMCLTITLLSIGSIFLRRFFVRAQKEGSRSYLNLDKILRICAACIVILTGSLLFSSVAYEMMN